MTSRAPRKPVAYIVLGGAGSGKSTVAQRISSITGAAYLDKDAIAGPFVELTLDILGHSVTDRESNSTYLDRVMPVEYATLFTVAGRNLDLGLPVVIDAPFVAYMSDPGYMKRSVTAAQWPDTDVVVIHVTASAEVVRQRLIDRGLPRDQVKLENWESYWPRFGSLQCAWAAARHHVFVNDDAESLRALDGIVAANASRLGM